MYAFADEFDRAIQSRYRRWKQAELPAYLRRELGELKAGDLTERFYKQLEFGLEGVVAKVGVGSNRLNLYTVRRLTLALTHELSKRGFAAQQRGVVVAYDNRAMSRTFAEQAALVLAKQGIKAYLFEQECTAPELAFAVRWLHAAAGMIISGGHYPLHFNGFKLYGEDGFAMTSEERDQINDLLLNMEYDTDIPTMDVQEAKDRGSLVFLGREVMDSYVQYQIQSVQSNDLKGNSSTLRIVYTPLYGAAGMEAVRMLKQAGFSRVYGVQEHVSGEPFPPMTFCANPQDPSIWEEPIRIAGQKDADLVLATDPCAQRLGVAVKTETGQYKLLRADQLEILLFEYLFVHKIGESNRPARGVLYKSIETTEMCSAMASTFGLDVIETLPGTANVTSKILERQEGEASPFFFVLDGSGGFLSTDFVRDKDAFRHILLVAEMAAMYKRRRRSLLGQLDQMYQKYGYHFQDEAVFSFAHIGGWQSVRNVMEKLRSEIGGTLGTLRIDKVYDYREGQVRSARKRKVHPTDQPMADIVKFAFEGGAWCIVRTSEMEPQLDICYGCKESSEAESRRTAAKIRSALLYYIESII